jgi:hypothetical protein
MAPSTLIFLFSENWELFPLWVKWLECETDHPSSYSAEVESVPICLNGMVNMHRNNLSNFNFTSKQTSLHRSI